MYIYIPCITLALSLALLMTPIQYSMKMEHGKGERSLKDNSIPGGFIRRATARAGFRVASFDAISQDGDVCAQLPFLYIMAK